MDITIASLRVYQTQMHYSWTTTYESWPLSWVHT